MNKKYSIKIPTQVFCTSNLCLSLFNWSFYAVCKTVNLLNYAFIALIAHQVQIISITTWKYAKMEIILLANSTLKLS